MASEAIVWLSSVTGAGAGPRGGRDPGLWGFLAAGDRGQAQRPEHSDAPRRAVVGHAGEAAAGTDMSLSAMSLVFA